MVVSKDRVRTIFYLGQQMAPNSGLSKSQLNKLLLEHTLFSDP